VVFERTWTQGDVAYPALAQVAADCLTGADRMPAEGEALLEWMRCPSARKMRMAVPIPTALPPFMRGSHKLWEGRETPS